MARPKKRKYVSKTQRLINKGEYKPRPKGRPPKNSEWNYKRGQYEKRLPKELLKAANERLRKLEKVSKLSGSSEMYQLMKTYAESFPKTKGKIYDQQALEEGKLRFISKQKFDQLSAAEKEYYIERLERFMASNTTTKAGIKAAHKQSYTKFMERYGKKFPNLSQEQYEEFFKTYNYNVVGDSDDHFSYSEWVKVLTNIRIDDVMTDNEMETVMQYVRSDNWVGLRNSEYAKYLTRI